MSSLLFFFLDYTKNILYKEVFPTPFIVPKQEILSFVDYKEKIVIYTGRFRRPCEISHLVVSQGMRNCPSLNPAAAPPLDFSCYAKLLHVGFLPLVFFLASLIGLATYCQAWKRAMKCFKTHILHVFELQLALPWIAQNSPSFFACFNDQKATKNTKTSQKIISNPC